MIIQKKGQAGSFNYPFMLNNSSLELVNVTIKNVQEQLSSIINKNIDDTFVLKIDCEGGEFEIFEMLDSIILGKINLIIIEWHWKKPNPLLNQLHLFNFSTITNSIDENSGIIYAFKKR